MRIELLKRGVNLHYSLSIGMKKVYLSLLIDCLSTLTKMFCFRSLAQQNCQMMVNCYKATKDR